MKLMALDKENFYDMMNRMCKILKRDCEDEYDFVLGQLDFQKMKKYNSTR
jgi:hypothetical protein